MKNLVTEAKDPQNPWKHDADDMAIVADVHTDSNSDQCLEVGVGYPLEIFVIVNEGGVVRIARGAIFSYYEFTQPIADRLTDEKWRKLLVSENPPKMPEWVSSFMDPSESQPTFWDDSPDNLFQKEFSGVTVSENDLLPRTVQLKQNYPNPFNSNTNIQFELSKAAHVEIQIYNPLGQKIKTLMAEQKPAGFHIIQWDGKDYLGRNIASGVYFYSLEVDKFRQVKKMVLLR
jgi:hypothetical protein